MSKRTCRYCRFSTQDVVFGLNCRRNPPVFILNKGFSFPTVACDHSCGEWKDDSTSPEAEARQDLRQQLVVAMVAAGSTLNPGALWEEATRIAACDPEVNNE